MQFKQLETGENLADIEVTCTRAEAEEFKGDLINAEGVESPAYDNVSNALGYAITDRIVFIIPGEEAADCGELSAELEAYIDDLNEKAIAKAEVEND